MAIVALTLTAVSERTFSDAAWDANQDIYDAILRHPFLAEMQDGSLDRETFGAYLVQDAHYLRAFAQALRVAAAKAPRPEWAALLRAAADAALKEEMRLHDSVLGAYGITPEATARTELSADAFAYVNYLLATAHDRPFGEAIAALLPCYWIYREVGKALAQDGSPDATYQQWIDTYASESYGASVEAILAIANEVATQASPDARRAMHAHFRRASRYEWMFWDAAYHRRGWPRMTLAPTQTPTSPR